MEEEKAAAYYDELARKGEGAARFKRGLGFSSSSSSSSDPFSSKTSASPFSQFVRASSPGRAERQAQLASVQRRLGRSPSPDRRTRDKDSRRSSARERDNESRRRERSGRSPSRRHKEEYDDEERKRRRRRSRSSSREDQRRRGRSRSPPRKREKSSPRRESSGKNKNSGVDYSLLIENYSQMTPAERVKAKMKIQLSQTAAKDTTMGMKTGWERFDFNKEAPLDEDEIEEADDDASLVKDIGQSFRFSAVKAKHEEEVKNAHDEAMFGAPVAASPVIENQFPEEETVAEEDHKRNQSELLISNKVLAMQQGSWRDRARKLQSGSRN